MTIDRPGGKRPWMYEASLGHTAVDGGFDEMIIRLINY